jgi:hypothetical protein
MIPTDGCDSSPSGSWESPSHASLGVSRRAALKLLSKLGVVGTLEASARFRSPVVAVLSPNGYSKSPLAIYIELIRRVPAEEALGDAKATK